jgi:hypothetical protein
MSKFQPKSDVEIEVNGVAFVRKDSLPKASALPTVNNSAKHPFVIGKQWIFETVTKYWVGDIVAVTETEVVLERAAWIADTGRFNEFMKTGKPSELEPANGPVVISRGGYVVAYLSPNVTIEVL